MCSTGKLFKYQFICFIDIVFAPNINVLSAAKRPIDGVSALHNSTNTNGVHTQLVLCFGHHTRTIPHIKESDVSHPIIYRITQARK